MAQAEQIAGNHLLSDTEPLGDGIAVVLQGTEIDRRLQGEEGRGGNHATINSPLDPGQVAERRVLLSTW